MRICAGRVEIFSKIYRLIVPYLAVGLLYMLSLKWIANYYLNETIKAAVKGFLEGKNQAIYGFASFIFVYINMCSYIENIRKM